MCTKKLLTLSFIATLLFICSCKEDAKEQAIEETPTPLKEEIKEIPSVCIWEKASVRAEPSNKGKWLSSMALGEKVTWLGITAIDSTDKNREFLKIRLSDSAEGWSSVYTIATDAKPSVALKEVSLYLRPDLLTVTDNKFQPMEMIAITKEENSWLQVVGSENKKKGWIQDGLVSTKEEDIAVASLASKALAETDSMKKIEGIESIINNSAFTSSVFLPELQKQLAELKEQE